MIRDRAPSKLRNSTLVRRSILSSVCVSWGTVVDSRNQVATFNPSAPGTPTSTTLSGLCATAGTCSPQVACPSLTQCTVVGSTGHEATFKPTAPGTPSLVSIDSSNALNGLACPSATQCTAVDSTGHELTFNPQSPGTPTPVSIDAAVALNALTCQATSECVAVDADGREVVGIGPGFGVATLKVTRARVAGKTARVSLSCAGAACRGTLTLSVEETLKGGKLVGVSAHAKGKVKHKLVVLRKVTVTLAAGKTETVALRLNGTGNGLLKKRHKLKVELKLTVPSGKTTKQVFSKTLSFKYPKPKHKH
jgi:hypothetical protein